MKPFRLLAMLLSASLFAAPCAPKFSTNQTQIFRWATQAGAAASGVAGALLPIRTSNNVLVISLLGLCISVNMFVNYTANTPLELITQELALHTAWFWSSFESTWVLLM